MFKDLKPVYKVLIIILAVGVAPCVTIGTVSLIQSGGSLSAQVFDQLAGLRDAKKIHITTFFNERRRDLHVLCDIVREFKGGDTAWDPQAMERFFSMFIEAYEYYDLFIIHPNGDILYSVAKESDYHSNLIDGRYAASNLGELIRKILRTKSFGMADFAPYPPSHNEPAAFVAEPLLEDGQIQLIIALQLSIEAIDRIMMMRTGLGETGETYLVGEDMLMRSDSYLDPVHRSIRASFANPEKGRVETVAVREALDGKTGEDIITDYNGNPVLSSYTPIYLWDITWALIAEIDANEAFEPINHLTWLIVIIAVIGISAVIAVVLLIGLLFFNRPSRQLKWPQKKRHQTS